MSSSFSKLESSIRYQFKDTALLERALTHRSANAVNNERLEFLGDAVLNFIVADILFHKFVHAHEGQLTRLRSSLVKEQALANWAREFSLSDYIVLGLGEKKSGGFRRESILADCVEAIIGAIYLDSDFETCVSTIKTWLDKKISENNISGQKDPKTQLQEWLQGKKLALPTYEVIDITGKPHEQTFTVKCEVDCYPSGVTAQARSRRIAEQEAAKQLLERLQEK